MKKSMKLVSVLSALCAGAILQGNAIGQTTENKPVNHANKASVAQTRASQKSEKGHPKTPERSPADAAAQTATPVPAVQAQPAPAPGTETQNFQGWVVTCLPPPADKSPRTCVARMGVVKSNGDRRPILFMSVIKTGGSATFVVQTPTGVEIKSGVTVQVGTGAPRKLAYESCEPALCTATVPMDDPFVQELAAAPNAKASWVGIGVGEVRVEYALQEARNTLAYLVSR